jgi:hypothetical protein
MLITTAVRTSHLHVLRPTQQSDPDGLVPQPVAPYTGTLAQASVSMRGFLPGISREIYDFQNPESINREKVLSRA